MRSELGAAWLASLGLASDLMRRPIRGHLSIYNFLMRTIKEASAVEIEIESAMIVMIALNYIILYDSRSSICIANYPTLATAR